MRPGAAAERMDTLRCVRAPRRNRRLASVHFPRGASMTDAEQRIVAFLMTSGATRPADLPDWLLALLEDDRHEETSHELIPAATLMYVRRLHPGIGFAAARALIAEYAADPAKLEDLSARITAFRLSCCFERLRRAGRLEEVLIDDAFDPEGVVSVKLPDAGWRPVDPGLPPRDSRHGPRDFSLN